MKKLLTVAFISATILLTGCNPHPKVGDINEKQFMVYTVDGWQVVNQGFYKGERALKEASRQAIERKLKEAK